MPDGGDIVPQRYEQQRPRVCSEQSIQDAARMMAEIDAGAIPVGKDDRLIGIITDRDIAVRAVAAGKTRVPLRTGKDRSQPQ